MISDVPDRPRDRRAHRPRAGAAVVVPLAVAVIALGGCGGGGADSSSTTSSTTTSAGTPPSTSSNRTTTSSASTTNTGGGKAGQRHSIPDIIDAVLTSADPAKACGADYVTAHYLNVAYGGKEGCVEAQSSGSVARSLSFGDVVPERSATASMSVTPKGGIYNGEKLHVTLVREDGVWKVDTLKSNAPVGP